MEVVARNIDLRESAKGDRYLSLGFGRSTVEELDEERAEQKIARRFIFV